MSCDGKMRSSISTEKSQITIDSSIVGSQKSDLDVEDPSPAVEEISYPTGTKLWFTYASVLIFNFAHGLDLTMVAPALPKLTDDFGTVDDIGWYSATYGLASSALIFTFGKAYTTFPLKHLFLSSIVIFEIGSVLCTTAPCSAVFILGRAVTGVGASSAMAGSVKIVRYLFPLHRQALARGLNGGFQSLGLILAPIIGGVLIDVWNWRACFGLNLPVGILCFMLTWFGFESPQIDSSNRPKLMVRLRRIPVIDTILIVAGVTCTFMLLQWGGTVYEWADVRIIILAVLGPLCLIAFLLMQWRNGDNATLPPRITAKRSLRAGVWYCACCNGVLAVTENYLAVYFQGVRGYPAAKSGLFGIPMIAGLAFSLVMAGFAVNKLGYYFPLMFGTSVLAPIACGLLTTLKTNSSIPKASALSGFLGLAMGLGIQGPMLAVQAVLDPKDVSIGGAALIFGGGMGSALSLGIAATVFRTRLTHEMLQYAPSLNSTQVISVGLTGINRLFSDQDLEGGIKGYSTAVTETLYIPLSLAILSWIGAVAIERRCIKAGR